MTALPQITIATNNGEIGGGEVMLLNIAAALRNLDRDVAIVAPRGSGEISQLADEARSRGFEAIGLPAQSRREWMRQLRSWDRREREGILWCNGLVPSAATAGHRNRIVHLHQRPRSAAQRALLQLAEWRSMKVLVPSEDMQSVVAGSSVLENWTEEITAEELIRERTGVIGFLGRPSTEKGVEVLIDALLELEARSPGEYRLAMAGTAKFVDAASVSSVESAIDRAGHLILRLGWVGREELFSQINVLVVPSVVPESFGLVAAEAMAAGVPVIVSNAGALPEVVGRHGCVTPAGKPGALADAIEETLANDETTQRRTTALRRRWEESFSPQAGQARVEALLEAVSTGAF